MPKTEVVLFSEDDGSVPLLEWLDAQPAKVQEKCILCLEGLQEMGHELQRPEADFLRDNIHELRLRFQRVQYRMLYFPFKGIAAVTHGLTNEGQVPEVEIDRAIERKARFEKNPGQVHPSRVVPCEDPRLQMPLRFSGVAISARMRNGRPRSKRSASTPR